MSVEAYPLVFDWIGTEAGRLFVHTGKVDIGQRITTAIVRIVEEELGVPGHDIDVLPVRTAQAPDEGITSGSNSVEQSGHAIRCAAATLREAVLDIAVARHGGAPEEWRLRDGILNLPQTNLRFALTELMEDVPRDIPVDVDLRATLRAELSGPGTAMRGLRDLVRGRFVFIQDLDPPGLLHARIVRPPHTKARLSQIAPDAIEKARERGLHVIRDGSFIALAGAQEWAVVQGAARLSAACDWDLGGGLAENDVFERLVAENARRFPVVDGMPRKEPVAAPLQRPDYAARFERPYQMHAALGPSAGMAEWRDGTLGILSHSQGVYPLRDSIADSLGLAPERVEITHIPGSGCYGHNGADDAAFEAALVAMALPDTPILLKWTREDEHCWEPYAPAMAVEIAARLEDGKVAAFSAETFGDTHRGRPRPGPDRAGPGRLLANRFREEPIDPPRATPNMNRHAGLHRNLDPVYDFAETRCVKNLVDGFPHRSSALRTLGAASNIFAIESFMDEAARLATADPLAFRRAHLSDPRGQTVLDRLAETLAAMPPPSESGGRGIAYAQYKNQMTRVGIAIDIDCSDMAEIRLRRAVLVADAGRVIDPDGLAAQLEGGLIQAASWALCEEVRWDRDEITSRDWDSYPVIRFDNIPEIHLSVIERPDDPAVGAGEASSGPTVAAIANAVFDATGIRMRRLPFTPEAILETATKS